LPIGQPIFVSPPWHFGRICCALQVRKTTHSVAIYQAGARHRHPARRDRETGLL